MKITCTEKEKAAMIAAGISENTEWDIIPDISEIEIESCPFCGSTASLRRDGDGEEASHYVVCDNRDCNAYSPYMFEMDSAVKWWNRRA